MEQMATPKKELTLTRTIHAPRTFVWKVWTDPKLVAQWWGPKGFTNPVCKLDVRPDGYIHIDMRAPNGVVYPMTGMYHEISAPQLLVFTSSALDKNSNPLFKVFNVITFADQKGETKLIMHASVSDLAPEGAPYLAGQEEGWSQTLARLEEFIAKEIKNKPAATNNASRWSAWQPRLQSVLRIVAAFMFLLAGTVKLFAFPAGMPPNGGTVQLISQLGLGAILETFGGALLLFGLFTRPVAFILAGEMAVAYFQFHFPGGIWPVMNGGVPAVLYCFVWLYFSAAGAGPWSLDAIRGK
jgi:putative oxidoreductase